VASQRRCILRLTLLSPTHHRPAAQHARCTGRREPPCRRPAALPSLLASDVEVLASAGRQSARRLPHPAPPASSGSPATGGGTEAGWDDV